MALQGCVETHQVLRLHAVEKSQGQLPLRCFGEDLGIRWDQQCREQGLPPSLRLCQHATDLALRSSFAKHHPNDFLRYFFGKSIMA